MTDSTGNTLQFPGASSTSDAPSWGAPAWPELGDVRHVLLEQLGQPPVVLLVAEQENDRRMLSSLLRREGCHTIDAHSCDAAMKALAETRPDLIILDRDMESIDGLECCRKIKANRKTELTPVLMITAVSSVADEIAGIQAGADEYLSKPLHPAVFRARTRALIRHKIATDRLEESESILFALAQAVEKRDHCTAGHCQRLAIYSIAFGMRLGLPEAQLLALYRGGYLHDIGKIAIPDSILFKPGKLTPEEWVLMQTHSVRGEEICRPLRSLETVLPIIRNHHERWDGGGYPDGLKAEKIPMLARVLQLVDVYDALTTERPYKQAFPMELALETLQSEVEQGWRDPELTKIFMTLPFADLDRAARASLTAEQIHDFEGSIRNLQNHLVAVAS